MVVARLHPPHEVLLLSDGTDNEFGQVSATHTIVCGRGNPCVAPDDVGKKSSEQVREDNVDFVIRCPDLHIAI